MVRVRIDVLDMEFERSAQIRNLFVSYSEMLLAQIQQTVACNALHTTRQRICRWLLMMHDRADGENLSYTHEFLAGMLGVNRKSVTLAAQVLKGRASFPIIGAQCKFSIVRASKRLRASATLSSNSTSTTFRRRLHMRSTQAGRNSRGHIGLMRRGLAHVTLSIATCSVRLLGHRRKAKTDYLVGGRFRLLLKFLNQARMAEPDASGVDET